MGEGVVQQIYTQFNIYIYIYIYLCMFNMKYQSNQKVNIGRSVYSQLQKEQRVCYIKSINNRNSIPSPLRFTVFFFNFENQGIFLKFKQKSWNLWQILPLISWKIMEVISKFLLRTLYVHRLSFKASVFLVARNRQTFTDLIIFF